MRCPSFSNLFGCAAAVALGLSHAGCSFTFIETVPDNPETLRYFDCTSTAGLPVADGVIGLSNGVSAVTTLTQSEKEFEDENDGANRNVVAGVSIAAAAISVASAIYGIVQTERCRSAKEDLRSRLLPDAEREQKKLRPPLEPPAPAPSTPTSPSGAMPGAPTMVEPIAPEAVPPQSAPPTGVPQAAPSAEPAPETGGAPQTAPPQSAPPPAESPKPAPPQPAPSQSAPPQSTSPKTAPPRPAPSQTAPPPSAP